MVPRELPRASSLSLRPPPGSLSSFLAALPFLLVAWMPGAAPSAAAQEPAPPDFVEELGALGLDPLVGPRGTEVSLLLPGLPPNTGFVIAFGGLRGGYQWVEQVTTDEMGVLDTEVRVPDWAEEEQAGYFFVKLPARPPFATRAFFVSNDAQGPVRLRGEITEDGESGVGLYGPEGEPYCLFGELPQVEPGARVVVEGSFGNPEECSEGIPLVVERMELL